MTNKMTELYELTRKFNDISGANKELSLKAMREQFLYIDEEVNEIKEALDNNDLVELLDGTIDTIITAFGLLQKLENLGVDVGQAGIDTAHNNLSKFPNAPAVAHQTVEKVGIEKGIEAVATFNEEHGVYVIRNKENGKVLKCVGYIPNDLGKYITESVYHNYREYNNV